MMKECARTAGPPPQRRDGGIRTTGGAESGTAVLIPAYNCGPYIAGVVGGLAALNLDVWVVSDGSSDDTAVAAEGAGARVLQRPQRSGKGSAVRWGLDRLFEIRDPDWVLLMDGDGQHRPEEAARFMAVMDGPFDLLLGSRMPDAGVFPPGRLLANRYGSLILKWMTGQPVPDTQCGFRAFRRELLSRMDLESTGFEIETEMLMKAMRLNARWHALPVSAVYNGQGSHYRPVADTYTICMAALRYVRG